MSRSAILPASQHLFRAIALLSVLFGMDVRPASAVPLFISGSSSPSGGGGYDYDFSMFFNSSNYTIWRLPILNSSGFDSVLTPNENWTYTLLTRPGGGWDPAIWDPTQLGGYAKGNDLDDPPFLLEFTGPEMSGSLSGFGFHSSYASVDAPGNITDGSSTWYFDPPTPNAPLIPEPGSAALLAAGLLPLLVRRRCRR